MQIQNSTLNDLDLIFEFYDLATQLQDKVGTVSWPKFDRGMVIKEIDEKRQWKLIVDKQVACVWATTYSDIEIWKERNDDPSVYIHRIATHPNFRGRQLAKKIVDWAKTHAQVMKKDYIRLDTVGKNEGLIRHYENCGFEFLGLFKMEDFEKLPAHYHNAEVSLFELKL